MEKNGDGLRDEIAPDDLRHRRRPRAAPRREIVFSSEASIDPLRGAPQRRILAGMDLAELDLMQGKADDAADLAEKAMADPKGDHGRARYVLARLELMQGDPEKAITGFNETLSISKDPRTLAWSHIYLGRLYDSMTPPDRDKAVAEYKEALAVRDSRPDTKIAAETGLKKPFALPAAGRHKPSADDKDFDPTGKAEKEAYKPGAPK